MSWKGVAKLVGKFAPLLGRVLGGPAGGVAGEVVAAALGVEANPEKVLEAIEVQADADQVLRSLELEHQFRMSEILLLQEQSILASSVQASTAVNQTMRAEMQAEHWFYRSWRPAYGWLMGICFFMVVVYAMALIWFRPESVAMLINFINATLPLWMLAFAVVGVYVHKRSVDKRLLAGHPTPTSASVREKLEHLF